MPPSFRNVSSSHAQIVRSPGFDPEQKEGEPPKECQDEGIIVRRAALFNASLGWKGTERLRRSLLRAPNRAEPSARTLCRRSSRYSMGTASMGASAPSLRYVCPYLSNRLAPVLGQPAGIPELPGLAALPFYSQPLIPPVRERSPSFVEQPLGPARLVRLWI